MAREWIRKALLQVEPTGLPARRAGLLSVSITSTAHLLELALGLGIMPDGGSAELRERLQEEVLGPYGQLLGLEPALVQEA